MLYHGTKEERAVMRKLHFKRKSRNDPLPVVRLCPAPLKPLFFFITLEPRVE